MFEGVCCETGNAQSRVLRAKAFRLFRRTVTAKAIFNNGLGVGVLGFVCPVRPHRSCYAVPATPSPAAPSGSVSFQTIPAKQRDALWDWCAYLFFAQFPYAVAFGV